MTENPTDRRGPGGSPPGHQGNVAHEPTPESRKNVETYASAFCSQVQIAAIMGISEATVRKYYTNEFRKGRGKQLASLGAMLLKKAAGGNVPAMIFALKTQGRWSETMKMEHTGADGAPLGKVDLSSLTDEELALYGQLQRKLAIAAGYDPGGGVGQPPALPGGNADRMAAGDEAEG